MTGPGCISAGVIGPLRPRDIIIVVKRARGIRSGAAGGTEEVGDEEGEGGGRRCTLVIDPTTLGIDAASG